MLSRYAPPEAKELKAAVKWHDTTAANGPRHEDSIDKIQSWLDSFGD